jgi:hypothetical protein
MTVRFALLACAALLVVAGTGQLAHNRPSRFTRSG